MYLDIDAICAILIYVINVQKNMLLITELFKFSNFVAYSIFLPRKFEFFGKYDYICGVI